MRKSLRLGMTGPIRFVMMRAVIITALASVCVMVAPRAALSQTLDQRAFCTPQGPFLIFFLGIKTTGVYHLKDEQRLGIVNGETNGQIFLGQWGEKNTQGVMEIDFSRDRSSFTARQYAEPDGESAVPDNPDEEEAAEIEPVLEWDGYLPPAGKSRHFMIDGIKYLCE